MRTGDYELLGYLVLIIYILIVFSQALELYQIASAEWHVLDWIVVLAVLPLMPGVPGLMLIIPAKFLDSIVAIICQTIGLVGILAAFAWGFVFSPQWWIIALLAILLNWTAHQVYKEKRTLV
ncbi:hypothetical protein OB919_20805 [Halobacteria archaeon AArc-curdl1]|uniref:Uncharacterized protein n=1 Tax=Natronosalvus hydrolyticus TaxID=2979988 RepID=A0AAP2ZBV7_9EURY|nr:hypothetical protein [Halobacteria archaeon AArc-curdl1]